MSKPYSTEQQIVLAVVPCITGTFSILGSGTILYVILSNKSKSTYNRLLLAMSSLDIMGSVRYAFMLSTVLVPKGTPGAWGAHGTTTTCTASGFFWHFFGLAVPFYNGALSLFYVLKVRYEVNDNIISTKVEPFMHLICILFPLATGIVGVALDLFNPLELGSGCWFSPYPMGCDSDSSVECTRGENSNAFSIFFAGIPVAFLFVFISSCMASIYFKVRSQERRMSLYSFRGSITSFEAENSKTRQTAAQALLYIGAFFLTYTWGCVERLLQGYANVGRQGFLLSLLSLIFLPMQGFFNFLIFIRVRYQKARRQNQDKSWLWILKQVICTQETTTYDGGQSRRRLSLRELSMKSYNRPSSSRDGISTNMRPSLKTGASAQSGVAADVEEVAQ